MSPSRGGNDTNKFSKSLSKLVKADHYWYSILCCFYCIALHCIVVNHILYTESHTASGWSSRTSQVNTGGMFPGKREG